mgnify:CR=1 FL=1
MSLVASVVVALVALLHFYFLVLEMFLWDKPAGMRAFGQTPQSAAATKVLAANQGLYNGFLAADVNGGPAPGFSSGQARIEAQLGKEDARRCFALAEESKALLRERDNLGTPLLGLFVGLHPVRDLFRDVAKLDLEKFKTHAARKGIDPDTIPRETILNSFNPVQTWIEFTNRLATMPLGFATLLLALFSFGR